MRFLSKKQVRDLISLSFASIDRMEASGHFPLRIRLGQLRVVWLEEQVIEWMRQRIKEGTRGNSYWELTEEDDEE
ncbi:MAG: AlpA family phage regulatory protein [Devosia sp.]|nr:AlpA family phage regulatory protein [Devosia sp.]